MLNSIIVNRAPVPPGKRHFWKSGVKSTARQLPALQRKPKRLQGFPFIFLYHLFTDLVSAAYVKAVFLGREIQKRETILSFFFFLQSLHLCSLRPDVAATTSLPGGKAMRQRAPSEMLKVRVPTELLGSCLSVLVQMEFKFFVHLVILLLIGIEGR